MDFGNEALTDKQSIADAFAHYFQSVFERGSESQMPVFHGSGFDFPDVTDDDILSSIKSLKPKKATGSDNIPSYIFKGCANFLLAPLKYLFNLSFKQGCFPDKLKESIVTPIFKKGKRNNIMDYRPISLLNNLGKIFEKIIYKSIFSQVSDKISVYQHGFLPDRSTITNLCIFCEHVSNAILNKQQLDVIYTDCAKAFDKVDHGILIRKLKDLGFSGRSLKLLDSYLSGRSQRVKVGNILSFLYFATSGVPQGSNLGPLLFLLFSSMICLKV